MTGQPLAHLMDLDEEWLVTLYDVWLEREKAWTKADHQHADVVEHLAAIHHAALIGPHLSGKGAKAIKPPKPIQRPGAKRRRKGTTLAAMMQTGGEVVHDG